MRPYATAARLSLLSVSPAWRRRFPAAAPTMAASQARARSGRHTARSAAGASAHPAAQRRRRCGALVDCHEVDDEADEIAARGWTVAMAAEAEEELLQREGGDGDDGDGGDRACGAPGSSRGGPVEDGVRRAVLVLPPSLPPLRWLTRACGDVAVANGSGGGGSEDAQLIAQAAEAAKRQVHIFVHIYAALPPCGAPVPLDVLASAVSVGSPVTARLMGQLTRVCASDTHSAGGAALRASSGGAAGNELDFWRTWIKASRRSVTMARRLATVDPERVAADLVEASAAAAACRGGPRDATACPRSPSVDMQRLFHNYLFPVILRLCCCDQSALQGGAFRGVSLNVLASFLRASVALRPVARVMEHGRRFPQGRGAAVPVVDLLLLLLRAFPDFVTVEVDTSGVAVVRPALGADATVRGGAGGCQTGPRLWAEFAAALDAAAVCHDRKRLSVRVPTMCRVLRDARNGETGGEAANADARLLPPSCGRPADLRRAIALLPQHFAKDPDRGGDAYVLFQRAESGAPRAASATGEASFEAVSPFVSVNLEPHGGLIRSITWGPSSQLLQVKDLDAAAARLGSGAVHALVDEDDQQFDCEADVDEDGDDDAEEVDEDDDADDGEAFRSRTQLRHPVRMSERSTSTSTGTTAAAAPDNRHFSDAMIAERLQRVVRCNPVDGVECSRLAEIAEWASFGRGSIKKFLRRFPQLFDVCEVDLDNLPPHGSCSGTVTKGALRLQDCAGVDRVNTRRRLAIVVKPIAHSPTVNTATTTAAAAVAGPGGTKPPVNVPLESLGAGEIDMLVRTISTVRRELLSTDGRDLHSLSPPGAVGVSPTLIATSIDAKPLRIAKILHFVSAQLQISSALGRRAQPQPLPPPPPPLPLLLALGFSVDAPRPPLHQCTSEAEVLESIRCVQLAGEDLRAMRALWVGLERVLKGDPRAHPIDQEFCDHVFLSLVLPFIELLFARHERRQDSEASSSSSPLLPQQQVFLRDAAHGINVATCAALVGWNYQTGFTTRMGEFSDFLADNVGAKRPPSSLPQISPALDQLLRDLVVITAASGPELRLGAPPRSRQPDSHGRSTAPIAPPRSQRTAPGAGQATAVPRVLATALSGLRDVTGAPSSPHIPSPREHRDERAEELPPATTLHGVPPPPPAQLFDAVGSSRQPTQVRHEREHEHEGGDDALPEEGHRGSCGTEQPGKSAFSVGPGRSGALPPPLPPPPPPLRAHVAVSGGATSPLRRRGSAPVMDVLKLRRPRRRHFCSAQEAINALAATVSAIFEAVLPAMPEWGAGVEWLERRVRWERYEPELGPLLPFLLQFEGLFVHVVPPLLSPQHANTGSPSAAGGLPARTAGSQSAAVTGASFVCLITMNKAAVTRRQLFHGFIARFLAPAPVSTSRDAGRTRFAVPLEELRFALQWDGIFAPRFGPLESVLGAGGATQFITDDADKELCVTLPELQTAFAFMHKLLAPLESCLVTVADVLTSPGSRQEKPEQRNPSLHLKQGAELTFAKRFASLFLPHVHSCGEVSIVEIVHSLLNGAQHNPLLSSERIHPLSAAPSTTPVSSTSTWFHHEGEEREILQRCAAMATVYHKHVPEQLLQENGLPTIRVRPFDPNQERFAVALRRCETAPCAAPSPIEAIAASFGFSSAATAQILEAQRLRRRHQTTVAVLQTAHQDEKELSALKFDPLHLPLIPLPLTTIAAALLGDASRWCDVLSAVLDARRNNSDAWAAATITFDRVGAPMAYRSMPDACTHDGRAVRTS